MPTNETQSLLNPYPGFRPFREEDSRFFFGRGQQIASCLRILRKNHILVIAGESGSGKSSLIQAGVLPRLQSISDASDEDDEDLQWISILTKPGNSPRRNLAESLACAISPENDPLSNEALIAELEDQYDDNSDWLEEIILEHLDPRRPILLVVDQFEELFRHLERQDNLLSEEHHLANRFVANLLYCRENIDRFHLAFTIRSEFIGQFTSILDLPGILSSSLYLCPRIVTQDIEKCIVMPAEKAGFSISKRLVRRLVAFYAAEAQGDGLCQLQHYLRTKASGQPSGTTIDLDGEELRDFYQRFNDNINDHLDKVFLSLSAEEQHITETLFRAFCHWHAGGILTRQSVVVTELAALSGTPIEKVIAVIEKLRCDGNNFVYDSGDSQIRANDSIEVQHECILRNWHRLFSADSSCATWKRSKSLEQHRLRRVAKLVVNAFKHMCLILGIERLSGINRSRSDTWAEDEQRKRATFSQLIYDARRYAERSSGSIWIGLDRLEAKRWFGNGVSGIWIARLLGIQIDPHTSYRVRVTTGANGDSATRRGEVVINQSDEELEISIKDASSEGQTLISESNFAQVLETKLLRDRISDHPGAAVSEAEHAHEGESELCTSALVVANHDICRISKSVNKFLGVSNRVVRFLWFFILVFPLALFSLALVLTTLLDVRALLDDMVKDKTSLGAQIESNEKEIENQKILLEISKTDLSQVNLELESAKTEIARKNAEAKRLRDENDKENLITRFAQKEKVLREKSHSFASQRAEAVAKLEAEKDAVTNLFNSAKLLGLLNERFLWEFRVTNIQYWALLGDDFSAYSMAQLKEAADAALKTRNRPEPASLAPADISLTVLRLYCERLLGEARSDQKGELFSRIPNENASNNVRTVLQLAQSIGVDTRFDWIRNGKNPGSSNENYKRHAAMVLDYCWLLVGRCVAYDIDLSSETATQLDESVVEIRKITDHWKNALPLLRESSSKNGEFTELAFQQKLDIEFARLESALDILNGHAAINRSYLARSSIEGWPGVEDDQKHIYARSKRLYNETIRSNIENAISAYNAAVDRRESLYRKANELQLETWSLGGGTISRGGLIQEYAASVWFRVRAHYFHLICRYPFYSEGIVEIVDAIDTDCESVVQATKRYCKASPYYADGINSIILTASAILSRYADTVNRLRRAPNWMSSKDNNQISRDWASSIVELFFEIIDARQGTAVPQWTAAGPDPGALAQLRHVLGELETVFGQEIDNLLRGGKEMYLENKGDSIDILMEKVRGATPTQPLPSESLNPYYVVYESESGLSLREYPGGRPVGYMKPIGPSRPHFWVFGDAVKSDSGLPYRKGRIEGWMPRRNRQSGEILLEPSSNDRLQVSTQEASTLRALPTRTSTLLAELKSEAFVTPIEGAAPVRGTQFEWVKVVYEGWAQEISRNGSRLMRPVPFIESIRGKTFRGKVEFRLNAQSVIFSDRILIIPDQGVDVVMTYSDQKNDEATRTEGSVAIVGSWDDNEFESPKKQEVKIPGYNPWVKENVRILFSKDLRSAEASFSFQNGWDQVEGKGRFNVVSDR